ncbi:uncharacterized protein EV420DRAFT_1473822 [Desarmillaria tabescens]|uniref:Uncharacterized protein n=1 Tax=Armillaria tabescens TaxID=1929756 RepID=A0AA39TRN2_ARMTA|nr:uncharacterized protein EV420DRAFT_1473822 [Desarmillaria tabescens]KAK0468057.1 hypothetical protein EV420DRAFT_1473822 [Desarmillaria tabescens]
MTFSVPSVPLGDFQQSFLPQVVSLADIDAIATRLELNGSLQPNHRWTLFPGDLCTETNENTCFKRLETIAAVIVKEAKASLNRNPTVVKQTRPTQAALSEGRNGQFISGSHFALCTSRVPAS